MVESVRIGNDEVHATGNVTYLGVTIDNKLKWKAHIQNIHQKCIAKLAWIRRVEWFLPYKVRKALYTSFVLPHAEYCSVVWYSCGVTGP